MRYAQAILCGIALIFTAYLTQCPKRDRLIVAIVVVVAAAIGWYRT